MAEPRVGVALTKCYYCGEGDRIVMNRLLTEHLAKKVKSMHGCVLDMEPCPKCTELMKQGVIIITIDPEKSGEGWEHEKWPNPHRSGGWFVLRDAAVKRIFPAPHADEALKRRWIFMEHALAEKIGLFASIQP